MPRQQRRVRPAGCQPRLEPLEDRLTPTRVVITNVPAAVGEGTAVTLAGQLIDDVGYFPPDLLPSVQFHWTVLRPDGTPFTEAFGSINDPNFTFTPDDNGLYTVQLEVLGDDFSDVPDYFGPPDLAVLNVFNLDPEADFTGTPEGPVAEGTLLELRDQTSDPGAADVLTYTWRVIRDDVLLGVFPGPDLDYLLGDNGFYLFQLRVQDDDGGTSLTTHEVMVYNVAPDVIVPQEQTATEGDTVTVVASIDDPGVEDTHTVGWTVLRDEQFFAAGTGLLAQFVPDDDGLYEVVFTATDDDGDSNFSSTLVTVVNAPPVVTAGPDLNVFLGGAVSLDCTFTDPGSADTHTSTWEVLSPSGVVVASGSGLAFSFSPTSAGVFTVLFTVTDDDGGTGSDTVRITVTTPPLLPPTSTPSSPPTTTPTADPTLVLTPLPGPSFPGPLPPFLEPADVLPAFLTAAGAASDGSIRVRPDGGNGGQTGGDLLTPAAALALADAMLPTTPPLVSSEVAATEFDPTEERSHNLLSVGGGARPLQPASGGSGEAPVLSHDHVRTRVLQTVTSVTAEDDSVGIIEAILQRPASADALGTNHSGTATPAALPVPGVSALLPESEGSGFAGGSIFRLAGRTWTWVAGATVTVLSLLAGHRADRWRRVVPFRLR